MNWISATGFSPYAAIPMAAPTIPVSASGVSTTRSGPKRPNSPSVTRNTPAVLSHVFSQDDHVLVPLHLFPSARFRAWTMFIVAISEVL